MVDCRYGGKSYTPEPDWRRQYELLLNSLPDAVLVCDRSGNLLDCNDAAARLSGYPREELLGLRYRKFLESRMRRKPARS